MMLKYCEILNCLLSKRGNNIYNIYCITLVIKLFKIFENWSLPNSLTAAAAAKLLQSCPTLCDPTDSSPPGLSSPGILEARILEWAATAFSNYLTD